MADSKKLRFSKSPILNNIFKNKLKNRQKMHYCVFRPFLNLFGTDSLPNKLCHINALLIQGPIYEIFAKKYWELAILKISIFLSWPSILNLFFQKYFFFASFTWKQFKVYWLAKMGQNFDLAKCDNTFWPRPDILHPSVRYTTQESMTLYILTYLGLMQWKSKI